MLDTESQNRKQLEGWKLYRLISGWNRLFFTVFSLIVILSVFLYLASLHRVFSSPTKIKITKHLLLHCVARKMLKCFTNYWVKSCGYASNMGLGYKLRNPTSLTLLTQAFSTCIQEFMSFKNSPNLFALPPVFNNLTGKQDLLRDRWMQPHINHSEFSFLGEKVKMKWKNAFWWRLVVTFFGIYTNSFFLIAHRDAFSQN